jgi:hypothetical protein
LLIDNITTKTILNELIKYKESQMLVHLFIIFYCTSSTITKNPVAFDWNTHTGQCHPAP